MNIKFISGILVSLVLIMAFASIASAAVDITTLTSSPVVAAGKPGDVVTYTLTVANTAGTPINVQFASSNLVLGASTITPPSIPAISNLVTGAPQTTSFTIQVPIVATGTYSGTISASEVTNPANTDSIPIALLVSSARGMDITTYSTTTPLVLSGQDGDTRASTITIKNTGTEILSGITFSKDDTQFTDADGNKAVITFSNIPSNIQAGQTADISVNIAIERGMNLGDYTGTINFISGAGLSLVQDSFNLEVSVQPEVCKIGSVGKLKLDVTDPDVNDEFKPGEKIKVKLNVDNNYNNDLDVTVDAFLYNLDNEDEIASASDTQNINDGDNADYEFELEMPLDNDNKESDSYAIFVKAYEDSGESKHCDDVAIEIQLNRDSDDVAITRFSVTPTTLSCGDSLMLEADVLNVGTRNQENAYIEFNHPDLKLNLRSPYFSIDKAGNDEDSMSSYRTTFVIPDTATERNYDIEGIVHFKSDTKRVSKFTTIAVSQCGPVRDVLTLSSTSFDVQAGNTFVVPFTLNNKKNSAEIYTVELTPVAGWATTATKQLNVAALGSVSDSLTLTPSTSVKTGTYSATLSVKSGSTVIGSQTLNVKLAGTTTGGQFVSTTSQFKLDTITIILIVAVVVLLILIIVLAVVMTGRGNKRIPAQPPARR